MPHQLLLLFRTPLWSRFALCRLRAIKFVTLSHYHQEAYSVLQSLELESSKWYGVLRPALYRSFVSKNVRFRRSHRHCHVVDWTWYSTSRRCILSVASLLSLSAFAPPFDSPRSFFPWSNQPSPSNRDYTPKTWPATHRWNFLHGTNGQFVGYVPERIFQLASHLMQPHQRRHGRER